MMQTGTLRPLDWTSYPGASKLYSRGPIAATMNPSAWTPGVSNSVNPSDPSTGAIGKGWQSYTPATTGPGLKNPSSVWFVLGLFLVTYFLEARR
jgi:hypothetical protein